ncbi:ribosomal protein L11 methyltransferase [Natronospira proteinivora]|uniref:Ribosomal protein L11 methyltransferase n=1 Tax=Natronospira proteinivora TaxID=1807133 RepID=A0ABT1GCI3_9GAMM|nr:50S ribosomal protein L11 methyltransferase [Natronospira proteinivora]MCP1728605.1 ribosomal protein L11 methyltransferase [Natronospira proteinivora]
MNWLKLSIKAGELDVTDIEAAMEALGAQAISYEDAGDQPLLEPGAGETPLWNETIVTGLFSAEHGHQALIDDLIRDWPGNSVPDYEIEVLEDRDWTLAWADHAKPLCFADKLWILPGETDMDLAPEAITVRIPPGLAFGTGSHPTTALCLNWLAQRVQPGMRVVDYGSGSGILAVAAARLGAKSVLAVDNDPQALVATWDNARANDVAGRIQAVAPDNCPAMQADLVIANILANPLIELAPRILALLAPRGELALTGVLEDQSERVTKAYADQLMDIRIERREDWVLIRGRKVVT